MIYKAAVINFLFLIGIALFYAFCHMTVVVDFKTASRDFTLFSDPPVLLAVSCGLVSGVRTGGSGIVENESAAYRQQDAAGKLVILAVCLLPTLQLLKVNSGMYLNVNQINNGSGITGYISWESWFSEDLMQEIDDAIGRDKSTYRVAHLGVSPAPALMHGFIRWTDIPTIILWSTSTDSGKLLHRRLRKRRSAGIL